MKPYGRTALRAFALGAFAVTLFYLTLAMRSPVHDAWPDPPADQAQVLRDAVDEMTFAPGMAGITGDPETGELCQMAYQISPDGEPLDNWYFSVIPGRDFREGSVEQRQEWIREHTRAELKEAGLASCSVTPDPFFRTAEAQRYCIDCGGSGGGCASRSCDATDIPGYGCSLIGATCVITVFCCPEPGEQCSWPC